MRTLPKIELHLHLDCSLSYAVVARLDPAVTRAEYDREFIAPPKCTSLVDLLTRAPRGFGLMQSEAALRLVTEDLFEQLGADGILYAEIRFAPLLHTASGLTAERVVTAVDRAVEAGIRASGIQARVILCALRHFDAESSLATARLVEQFRGSRVVALDLAGDEAGFAIGAHVPAFRYALDHDLYRTAHAGEARGADSVWETLREFKPTRIGHGARSIEDPALVEHLRRERIHLEICPTSNVQSCICDQYEHHPVDRLFRSGVSLGINTDSRTMTNVTLTEEYTRLQNHFQWGHQQLLACNQAALDAAFVEDEIKDSLRIRLISGYDDVGTKGKGRRTKYEGRSTRYEVRRTKYES